MKSPKRTVLRERLDIVLAVLVVALIGVSIGVLVIQNGVRNEIIKNRAVFCSDAAQRGARLTNCPPGP